MSDFLSITFLSFNIPGIVYGSGYRAPDAQQIGTATLPDTEVYESTTLLGTIEIFIILSNQNIVQR